MDKMPDIIPYDGLSDDKKQMFMSYAAHWLSIKPELIGGVTTDKELIDRLIVFAKVLYEYFPEKVIHSVYEERGIMSV
jgi:hypothetical protein